MDTNHKSWISKLHKTVLRKVFILIAKFDFKGITRQSVE